MSVRSPNPASATTAKDAATLKDVPIKALIDREFSVFNLHDMKRCTVNRHARIVFGQLTKVGGTITENIRMSAVNKHRHSEPAMP